MEDYEEDIKQVSAAAMTRANIEEQFLRKTMVVGGQMNNLTKEEFVHVLRRQSTGFPRGSSKYRGVTLHKCGRWEARMGQFLGKKYANLSIYISLSLSLLFSVSFSPLEARNRLLFKQIRLFGPLRHGSGSCKVKLCSTVAKS